MRADDASVAVVAHGLLNSVTVIRAAASLLDTYWERLDDGQRREMVMDIVRHIDLIGGVLGDLVKGLPDRLQEIDIRGFVDSLDVDVTD